MADDDPKPPAPAPKPDDKSFSQADVDRIVQERLAQERKKYADYDELKAKAAEADKAAASSKTDLEKLTEQIEGLKKAQAEADHKALRAEVAMAKGLSAAQAKRLAGNTREELEADADEILEAFPVPKDDPNKGGPPSRQPKPDLKGGGDPTEEPVETDPKKLAEAVPRL